MRSKFILEPATGAKEVWFSGVHSDVGGGYESASDHDSLASITFSWMTYHANKLDVDIAWYPGTTNAFAERHESWSGFMWWINRPVPRTIPANAEVHASFVLRYMYDYYGKGSFDWKTPGVGDASKLNDPIFDYKRNHPGQTINDDDQFLSRYQGTGWYLTL